MTEPAAHPRHPACTCPPDQPEGSYAVSCEFHVALNERMGPLNYIKAPEPDFPATHGRVGSSPRVVLVVELDPEDDVTGTTLVDATRAVAAALHGIPVHRVWAGIRETAAAVAALHSDS